MHALPSSCMSTLDHKRKLNVSAEKVAATACTAEQKLIQGELTFAWGQTVQPDGMPALHVLHSCQQS